MLKLELELEKIIGYNKSALFPILVLGAFLVYFFSVSDFSEENYHAVHGFFVGCVGLTLLVMGYIRKMNGCTLAFLSLLISESAFLTQLFGQ